MSLFNNLFENLKAQTIRLGHTIEETAWYAQMQDRYQSLSASGQRLVWLGLSAFFVLILVFYPAGKISNSQSLIASFEEKRTLIRELFRTYRESSGQSNLSVPPQAEGLKSAIDSILNMANLTPEQMIGTTQTTAEGRLIPANLVSYVIEVKLAKLNLKQIVDIGTSMTAISDSVKMKDMNISANRTDTRYFDVIYKLYSLNVPEPTPEPLPEVEVKPTKKPSAGKNTKAKDIETKE